MQFSALATLYSGFSENRQAKSDSIQIKSLKKISSCTFYTLETVLKLRIFTTKFLFSQLSDAPNGFNSSLRKRNNFIQGTGFLSIITFDVISLRSMLSSTQVCVYKRKSRVIFSIYTEEAG